MPKQSNNARRLFGMANKYFAFNGHPPRKVSKTLFNVPKGLVYLGEARQIEYLSSKRHGGGDGRKTLFYHHFKPGAKLYMDERAKGQLYILSPHIVVREAGIIN